MTYDEVGEREENAIVERSEPARQRHAEHLVVGAVNETASTTHLHLTHATSFTLYNNPYLTFGVNSLLNSLLGSEAIFDVGPVRIPDVTKVTITSMRLWQTATGLMVISYIAPRAVVCKPLTCGTLSA